MQWMILPFKRYADFQGRSRRMEFWMFQLFNTIISVVLAGPAYFSIMSAALSVDDNTAPDVALEAVFGGVGTLGGIGLALFGLYALFALIPSIALVVRRLHDRDLSGWWYLGAVVASLIPFIGFIASIALFVMFVLPGTSGANRFGADPKNPYDQDVFA